MNTCKIIDCKYSKEIKHDWLRNSYECLKKDIILTNECEECQDFEKGENNGCS